MHTEEQKYPVVRGNQILQAPWSFVCITHFYQAKILLC